MGSLQRTDLFLGKKVGALHSFSLLLQSGTKQAILTPEEVDKAQRQTTLLLQKQCRRFASGDTSLQEREAKSVFSSLLFCIGYRLNDFTDLTAAASALRKEGPEGLFTDGLKKARQQVSKAKLLLFSLQKRKIDVEIHAYQDTIDHGIPPFFSFYDPEYSAQEAPASIDYPLLNPVPEGYCGIEYLSCYLNRLALENRFCRHFEKESVSAFLESCDPEYSENFFNLCETLLTFSLAACLAGEDPYTLSLSEEGKILLREKLEQKTKKECIMMLREAFISLSLSFPPDPSLNSYLLLALPEISVRLKNAADNGMCEAAFF